MSEKMFETAVRSKFRFPFKGAATVEDLWDLSLQNLDSVFKSLNSELKQTNEESLLDTKTKQDEELDIKIAIVRHIVAAKKAERDAVARAKEKREQKQRILEILASKQDESLQNKSIDELQSMLNELD